jgi:hypothetical protein
MLQGLLYLLSYKTTRVLNHNPLALIVMKEVRNYGPEFIKLVSLTDFCIFEVLRRYPLRVHEVLVTPTSTLLFRSHLSQHRPAFRGHYAHLAVIKSDIPFPAKHWSGSLFVGK